MTKFSDIILAFLIGYVTCGVIMSLGESFTEIGGLFIGVFGLAGAFWGYKNWKIDNFYKLRATLKKEEENLKKTVECLLNKENEEAKKTKEKINEAYLIWFNELEFCANYARKRYIPESLFIETFSRYYQEIEQKSFCKNLISKYQENNPSAYERIDEIIETIKSKGVLYGREQK